MGGSHVSPSPFMLFPPGKIIGECQLLSNLIVREDPLDHAPGTVAFHQQVTICVSPVYKMNLPMQSTLLIG